MQKKRKKETSVYQRHSCALRKRRGGEEKEADERDKRVLETLLCAEKEVRMRKRSIRSIRKRHTRVKHSYALRKRGEEEGKEEYEGDMKETSLYNRYSYALRKKEEGGKEEAYERDKRA